MVRFVTFVFYVSCYSPEVFPPITYPHTTPPRHRSIPPEVYTDKQTRWENILEWGKAVPRDQPHLIPICTQTPTVPRTLVPEVGWRCYPDEECRCGWRGVRFRVRFVVGFGLTTAGGAEAEIEAEERSIYEEGYVS
jgi:hypothetical protein